MVSLAQKYLPGIMGPRLACNLQRKLQCCEPEKTDRARFTIGETVLLAAEFAAKVGQTCMRATAPCVVEQGYADARIDPAPLSILLGRLGN